jgi:hypothetical protein
VHLFIATIDKTHYQADRFIATAHISPQMQSVAVSIN